MFDPKSYTLTESKNKCSSCGDYVDNTCPGPAGEEIKVHDNGTCKNFFYAGGVVKNEKKVKKVAR